MQQEIHPLLRERMTLSGKPMPKLYLTTPQQLGSNEMWMCVEGLDECKPVPKMVMEAMEIVAKNNSQMEPGSNNWLAMCLGLMVRYHEMGYVEFEEVTNA